MIPGWEGFVRRVIDTEPLDVVVSGSSAQMLSAEIATNLRGRALETLLWPFSFREALRHQRLEPSITAEHWSSAICSRVVFPRCRPSMLAAADPCCSAMSTARCCAM